MTDYRDHLPIEEPVRFTMPVVDGVVDPTPNEFDDNQSGWMGYNDYHTLKLCYERRGELLDEFEGLEEKHEKLVKLTRVLLQYLPEELRDGIEEAEEVV